MRGSALTNVLVFVIVSLLFVLSMASASIFHLRFAVGIEAHQQAANLSESAIATALARVLDNDKYGPSDPDVEIGDAGHPPGSFGFASFDPGRAAARGVPHSTNNLGTTNEVQGALGPVPGSSVHIVGLGKVGDCVQKVEVLYHRPPFPKALVSTGPITTSGSLAVVGLQSDAVYPGSIEGIPAESRMPGSVQTNDKSADAEAPAVKLGGGTRVTGDVSAVGLVKVEPGAEIGGEIRTLAAPQPVPKVDIASYIEQLSKVSGYEALAGSVGTTRVDFFSGCSGDLVVNGDLELVNGTVFVKGDLTVTGGIKGEGLILVGGGVKIGRGTDFKSENVVALAAEKDVQLLGAGRGSYYFQGLVYTEGDFDAEEITVLGAIVANGKTPDKGRLKLKEFNMVQTEVAVVQGYGKPRQVEVLAGGDKGKKLNTWLQLSPSSKTGPEPLYNVRVRCKGGGYDVDVVKEDQTYAQLQAFLAAFKDGTPKVQGNEWSPKTLEMMMNDIKKPEMPGVLQMNFNKLMAPGDRARVLLWRNLGA